jgi:hypothetical protein
MATRLAGSDTLTRRGHSGTAWSLKPGAGSGTAFRKFFALFGGMGGTAAPTARSYIRSAIGASPEPHRSTLDPDRGYYGEAPGRPARRSDAWLEEPGAGGSTVWGATPGSDVSRRRGRRVKGQSRGTAWRVILMASQVTIPSERAKILVSGHAKCLKFRCPHWTAHPIFVRSGSPNPVHGAETL